MHFICLRPVDCCASHGGRLISPDSGCFNFLGTFEPAPGHGQVSGACILMLALPEHIAGSLLHAWSWLPAGVTRAQAMLLGQGFQSPGALLACRLCWSGRAL